MGGVSRQIGARMEECRTPDSLSGPMEPLSRALMGCGDDRPSVTVSRWIKESERRAQRREEEAEKETGGGIKPDSPPRGLFCLSLRDSSLSCKKKRLNPAPQNQQQLP